MIKYIVLFSVAAVISFLITPIIQLLAKKLNILDYPSERKIHRKPIPRLGGIPIFIAFNLTIALGFLINLEYFKEFYSTKGISILISQLVILGIGIYDDIKRVKPIVKLFFQIMAGSLLMIFGFGIQIITNPFTGNPIHLGALSIPITIIWLVGITNALNLVDGLDGLAAGTALIASIAIFGVSYINQNIAIALCSLVLTGSILGFLKYNFNPAKIFLGDSGSLLLGFLLAFLSIKGSSKGAILVAVLSPILVLGFPILDTILSMVRRFLKASHIHKHANRDEKTQRKFFRSSLIFEADKDHIHHRLLKLGLSQRKAVIYLYGLCIILCSLAFVTAIWKNFNITLFLGAIILASFIGINKLKYQEFKFFENKLFRPLFDISLINKGFFQAFIDLLFISLSYYFSFILVFGEFNLQAKTLFIKTIPLVLILKILLFYISGLYKGTWKYFGINELIKISKSLILSSVIYSFLLIITLSYESFRGISFFIIDFFILFTFVTGLRISYRIFDYFYIKQHGNKGGKTKFEAKNTVIYGAGRMGSLIARELLQDKNLQYHIVGFIDDNIYKKRNAQYNFPILGTIKELKKIVHEKEISEIIVSTDKISKEKIDYIKKLCNKNCIDLKYFELKLNKLNSE